MTKPEGLLEHFHRARFLPFAEHCIEQLVPHAPDPVRLVITDHPSQYQFTTAGHPLPAHLKTILRNRIEDNVPVISLDDVLMQVEKQSLAYNEDMLEFCEILKEDLGWRVFRAYTMRFPSIEMALR